MAQKPDSEIKAALAASVDTSLASVHTQNMLRPTDMGEHLEEELENLKDTLRDPNSQVERVVLKSSSPTTK